MAEICNLRSAAIGNAKKIIVKAGTRLLIDRKSIAKLVAGIAKLRAAGHQVLLVSIPARVSLSPNFNSSMETESFSLAMGRISLSQRALIQFITLR